MGDNGRGGRFNLGGGLGGGLRSGNNNNDGQKGNTSPCPGANGTTIGTSQSFTLQCGLNIGGDVLSETPMFSFIGCVDSCAATHPRCDGVSFNGRTCRLRAGANISQSSRPSDGFESALAIFPTGINPQCSTLGPSMQTSPSAGSKRYNVACGKVLDGGDFLQQHTATFFDCAELCARSSACVAVSYDWNMTGGFNNCYLKNSVADLVSVQDIDTAILSRGGDSGGGTAEQPANNPASPASSSPAAGGGSGQGVVLVPVPSGQPASSTLPLPTALNPAVSSGPSAPPAQASGATTRQPSQPVTAPGPSSATFVTSTRGTLVQPPAAGTGNTTPTAQPLADELPATAANSQAWIAAPVVGGVAAVMLITVVFAIWGRRRGWIRGWGSRDKSNGSDAGKSMNGEKGGSGSGQAEGDDEWLRDAERGAASMGANASRSIRSDRSNRSIRSSRSSISGLSAGSRPDSIPSMPPPSGQTPRYQVKNGRMALRDSQNGQLQNDTGTGAVPDFLRESRVERST